MADLRENIARVLLTEEEIQRKVAEMAAEISKDYEDKQLLLVGILKGSMVFMADLMRRLSINAKNRFYVGVVLRLVHRFLGTGADHPRPQAPD